MSVKTSLATWLQDSKAIFEETAMLTPFREQHKQALLKQGLPTRKNEYWKYADLAFIDTKNYKQIKASIVDSVSIQERIKQKRLAESILLVSVNGCFMPSLSDISKLPEQAVVCDINQAQQQLANCDAIDAEKYPFACLNTAVFNSGLFLKLPDHCQLTLPIHLLSLTDNQNDWMANSQHLFILGDHAQVTIFEEQDSSMQSSYFMNKVTRIQVGKQAQLSHYKLQNESNHALHTAYTVIQQKQDSFVSWINLSAGSAFARDDIVVKLEEPGANCQTKGFYHLKNANQYVDNHIDIQHLAAHSFSEMLFKGIIDKTASAVFNGRLYVEQQAQKITAYQANHNLLLSPQAQAYSKPELEIYADDVKCKHGATMGQLDEDALFYLRSRGIDYQESLAILLKAFAQEIIQAIPHAEIKLRLQEML